MKKIVKPASLLFSLLSLLVFFIIGMYFAGFIEAGKNQGLAGGAIVLGWGVLFAGVAFVLSFFVTYKVEHKRLVRANWILFVLLLIGYGITHYRFLQRDKLQKERNEPLQKKSTTPTPMAEPAAMIRLNEIATAPWLIPDRLKLGYDMRYFKIKNITGEFVEVVVNR